MVFADKVMREISVNTQLLKKVVLLTFLLHSLPTLAAPFCAVFSFGKQCYYYDYNACLQAAGTSGACVINQEEAKAPSGSAPFCVVASYLSLIHI